MAKAKASPLQQTRQVLGLIFAIGGLIAFVDGAWLIWELDNAGGLMVAGSVILATGMWMLFGHTHD